MILSRIEAQPSSRLSSTLSPCFRNKPSSSAITKGAQSVSGTNPSRIGDRSVMTREGGVPPPLKPAPLKKRDGGGTPPSRRLGLVNNWLDFICSNVCPL